MFSQWVENTVVKGEIAFPSVFKRLVLQAHTNQGLFGKGLSVRTSIHYHRYAQHSLQATGCFLTKSTKKQCSVGKEQCYLYFE